MRDLVYFLHLILGFALVALPVIVLLNLGKKTAMLKPMALLAAAISWVLVVPAGILYMTFYPATKTLIKAGAWPWAHSILMETKEHWGILLPVVASVAALLTVTGKNEQSKKWWILVIVLSVLLAVFGRIIKMGAFQ
ncbi:MAG: hypothetical protein Q7K34_04185 [archaeon]|nr:hypothetical protein [archaeon]